MSPDLAVALKAGPIAISGPCGQLMAILKGLQLSLLERFGT